MAVLLLAFPSAMRAQNSWNGGGGDNNWGTGANWVGGAPTPGTTSDIAFAGTTRTNPFNNYTAYDDFRNVLFASGAGTFSVTGTRFILKANAQQALLQVEEGSVRVEEGGRVMAVTANQQYFDDGRGGAVSEIRPDERAIFAAFVNATLDNAQLLKGAANRQPNPPRVVTVAVELFDGNHVSGELLSESAEALVIKPKNFQAITVKKTEIKSSTRK